MANYVSIPRDPSLIAAWSVAQDGMSSSAARTNVMIMPLIDGLMWVRQKSIVAGSTNPETYSISGQIKLKGSSVIGYETPSARTFTRCCGLPSEYRENRFSFADPGVYTQYSTASEGSIHWPVALPSGATLTQVEITIQPVPHVALPGTMPRLEVLAFDASDLTGAGDTVIGDLTDPSTLGPYGAVHTLTLIVSYTMASPETTYVAIRFSGETGANALDGMIVRPPRFTFTRATLEQD